MAQVDPKRREIARLLVSDDPRDHRRARRLHAELRAEGLSRIAVKARVNEQPGKSVWTWLKEFLFAFAMLSLSVLMGIGLAWILETLGVS